MAQGDFAQAQAVQLRAQGPPPELGAEGAGIFLPAVDENNLVDGHGDQVIGDLQRLAQLGDGGEVHPRRAAVDGHRRHLKGLGVERPQLCQGRQGQHRVLPAADAHGHRLARIDHMVVLHAPADQG